MFIPLNILPSAFIFFRLDNFARAFSLVSLLNPDTEYYFRVATICEAVPTDFTSESATISVTTKA